jgi:hypothetical protein
LTIYNVIFLRFTLTSIGQVRTIIFDFVKLLTVMKAKLEIFCLVIIFVFIKLFNRNESESTNINFLKMSFRTHYIRCLRIQWLNAKFLLSIYLKIGKVIKLYITIYIYIFFKIRGFTIIYFTEMKPNNLALSHCIRRHLM